MSASTHTQRVFLIFSALLLLPGCGGDDAIRPAMPGGQRIAFTSWRSGLPQIYVMNADGTGVLRLSSAVERAETPRWSPNGRLIAFVAGDSLSHEMQILLVSSSGANQVDLTNAPGTRNLDPAWSPGGTRIAFTSMRDGNAEIYVMNVDGSNLKRLTTNPASDFMPRWSPTGDAIAFLSSRDGKKEIYSMMPDGSGQSAITTPPHDVDSFTWSSHRKLAFSSFRDSSLDIYTIAWNGTGEARLTSDSLNQTDPAWSPDGERIAYFSHDGIHVVADGGSGDSWVPNSNYLGFGLTWSPDGQRIAFANLFNSDFDVLITAPDGTNRQNLTQSAGDDLDPAWEP